MESVIVICGTNQPLWLQVFKFQSCDPCRKKQVGVDLVDLKRGDKKLSQQQQQKSANIAWYPSDQTWWGFWCVLLVHSIRDFYFGRVVAYLVEFQVLQSE